MAKIQTFLIISTCFLYLVAAGLFSKAVWDFEIHAVGPRSYLEAIVLNNRSGIRSLVGAHQRRAPDRDPMISGKVYGTLT